jgi:ABC-2 type transport system ATP-binding protein
VVEIRDVIRSLRGTRTVLFSSHILSEVEAVCERVLVIARGRLVGEGTPAELGARLGARQRIVVRVDGPADEVGRALAALPGVARVEPADGAFVVEANGGGDPARAAGEAMQRSGWAVLELRHERLDLEDVFLGLIRDEGRA